MARQRKEHKPVSIKMNKELYEKLEAYCDRTYSTKTGTIERALSELFERETPSVDRERE